MVPSIIGSFSNTVSGIVNGLAGITEFVQKVISGIGDLFSGIDFTLLYDWLPNDIQSVVTACIAFLLVLALFGLLRRVLFFLG